MNEYIVLNYFVDRKTEAYYSIDIIKIKDLLYNQNMASTNQLRTKRVITKSNKN